MKVSDVLPGVEHPVAYYPCLAPVLGGVDCTLLVCQLLYWDGKQNDPEGWIFKTQVEIQHETGLSVHEQRRVRRILCERGILQEKRAGIPGRLHFRIDKESLLAEWEAYNANNHAIDNKKSTMWSTRQPRNRDKAGRFVDDQTASETPTPNRSIDNSMITSKTSTERTLSHDKSASIVSPQKPERRSSASIPKHKPYTWGATVSLNNPVHQAMCNAVNVTRASTDAKKREVEEAAQARLAEGATVQQVEQFVSNWWKHRYGAAHYGKAPTAKNLRDDWDTVLKLSERLANCQTEIPETVGDRRLKEIFGLHEDAVPVHVVVTELD